MHLRDLNGDAICGAVAWAGDELLLTDDLRDVTCKDCLADAPDEEEEAP